MQIFNSKRLQQWEKRHLKIQSSAHTILLIAQTTTNSCNKLKVFRDYDQTLTL